MLYATDCESQIRQNSQGEQEYSPNIQHQPPLPKQEFAPTDSSGFGLSGLFDDLLTPNPANQKEVTG